MNAGKPLGTTRCFPDDFDTTSIAWTVNPGSSKDAKSILDDMLTYTNDDGIITVGRTSPFIPNVRKLTYYLLQTYFDRSRTRTDPVVCVNVTHMFYYHRYTTPLLLPTEDYIVSVLQNRAYMNGTRYYSSPDAFLFFFSRLLSCPTALTLRISILPLYSGGYLSVPGVQEMR